MNVCGRGDVVIIKDEQNIFCTANNEHRIFGWKGMALKVL
jgi:hypothetical protein